MDDTKRTAKHTIDPALLDEFLDVETGSSPRHGRTLRILLGDIAIIVAIIMLGLLFS